jgi:hypothetical protein
MSVSEDRVLASIGLAAVSALLGGAHAESALTLIRNPAATRRRVDIVRWVEGINRQAFLPAAATGTQGTGTSPT